MGLLSFFNKNNKKIKDDLFGKMEYMTFKNPFENYYVGEVLFQGEMIGIDIDADESGPTDQQKEFFKILNKQYSEIKENSIIPFLKKELEKNIDGYVLKSFDSDFVFDGLTIRRIKTYRTKWQITYDCTALDQYFLVNFEDMKPVEVSFI